MILNEVDLKTLIDQCKYLSFHLARQLKIGPRASDRAVAIP